MVLDGGHIAEFTGKFHVISDVCSNDDCDRVCFVPASCATHVAGLISLLPSWLS